MGEWVVLFFLLKISKYYNCTKLTREPTESGMLPLNWLLDNHLPNGKWVSGLCSSFFENSNNYKCSKLTREPTESGMLPLNWLLYNHLPNGKCECVVLLKISKYYNLCKLTREPTESGMLPLNWLLNNHLPNGKWVSG